MARSDSAKGGWSTTWRGTAALTTLLVAAVAALLVWQPFTGDKPILTPGDGDRVSSELAHLTMLGHALKYHADEHDGRYPAGIADIEWRQAKPGMEANGLPAVASRFHHPDNGKVMDWLYYSGHAESDPPDTILVASPVAFGSNQDRRMVTRISNVTEVLAEGDFQRQTGQVP